MNLDTDALYARYAELFSFKVKEATLINEYTHVIPWGATILYLLMVFYLPGLLRPKDGTKGAKSKPSKSFTYMMALWNLFLSLLSLVMLLGVGIPYWKIIYEKGLGMAMCDQNSEIWNSDHPMLFWSYMFTLSKLLELVDTFFLIVKNPEREVAFLHWYHHFTVLLFTWYGYRYKFGTGGAFLTVNAFVHTVMYFYYFLKELGYDPSIVALPITIIQIAQMFVGIYITYVWVNMHYALGLNCSCENTTFILTCAFIMYGSYLFLFCKYFYKRYILGDEKFMAREKKGSSDKRPEKSEADTGKSEKKKISKTQKAD